MPDRLPTPTADFTSPGAKLPARAGLAPPRFGLPWLFGAVALFAILITTMKAIGPLAAAVMLLFLLAVAAHVLANVLGTRLRDEAHRMRDEHTSTQRPTAIYRKEDFPASSQLSHRIPLGRPLAFATTLFAFAGVVGGGLFWIRFLGVNVSIANVLLGMISCGVLGGLGGFWCCSFLQVFSQAVAQSSRQSPPCRPPSNTK